MNKEKHIILRKDISSGNMLPSNELIRVVKNKDGEVFIDQTKKANGRGVYIRPNLESLKKAQDNRLIEKGLKSKVPAEIYVLLQKEIEENWD